ncbi:MAG: hypothetical protein QM734_14385 [Cyclobacteriaceae bacterium]
MAASGTSLSYQWYSNTVNSNSGGSPVGGANASTYTPSTATTGTALYYYVVISNTCGSITSTSSGAITVNQALTVNDYYNPSWSQCQNSAARPVGFYITGGTGTITHQWYSSTSASNTGGTPIAGATSATYYPQTATLGTFYYYDVVTDACTSGTSQIITVTIDGVVPVITAQATVSYGCQGGTLTVGTNLPGSNCEWFIGNPMTWGLNWVSFGRGNPVVAWNDPANAHVYNVVVSNGCGSVTSQNVGVTVPYVPVLSSQSQSPVALCQNGTTALSVYAYVPNGTSLQYQWYSSTSNSYSGTAIPGATSAAYNPPSGTLGTYYYYVSISNYACNTLKSQVFTVNVITPTSITTQPSSAPQTVCQYGTSTPLTVAASNGGSLSYQWFSTPNSNSSSGGTPITGATSSSYTPPTNSTSAFYYYVVVMGSCNYVTSNVSGLITVNASPTITTQPQTQSVCQNGPATLSVAATGNGTLAYQWYSSNSNSYAGTPIGGANAATYSPASTSVGTTYYYVSVSDSGPCATLSSISAFTVNSLLSIATQPSSTPQTICQNGTASALSVVTSASGGANYQWYSNTANSNSGGTSVAGATSSSYVPSTTSKGTLYYYVVVSNSCGSATSAVSGPITSMPPPTITVQPIATQEVCQNGATQTIAVTATDAGPLTYQWFSNSSNSNSGGTTVSGANSSSFSPPTTSAGTTYYYVGVTGACGTVNSNVCSSKHRLSYSLLVHLCS